MEDLKALVKYAKKHAESPQLVEFVILQLYAMIMKLQQQLDQQ